ncbi:hypothetical protein PV08_02698 [Exophiala spinifera]|uniref:Uncharacterized protein n=1 Tax=Exophiala spinifera TaxID=91928 RepID=A0A0D2BIJ3_9EURO|nr:uncharacterized protein PV08_02698 [Exophiala spinifera]KIW18410.1 hypothetical protein PV08_02698 [Exophiala spinifera]
MEARTSLIQEFYGCLVLLRLLTPNRSRAISDRSVDPAVPRRNEWHVFLDSLAWLADHKGAGETVTSIAVEPSPARPTYWVASNSYIKPEALQHVNSVLSALQQETSLDRSSSRELIRKIARDSIEFSGLHVREYCRKLKSTIAAIDATEPIVLLGNGIGPIRLFCGLLLIMLIAQM